MWRWRLDVNSQIDAHYGIDDIYGRILTALRDVGIEPSAATVADLAPIDQFHTGGLPATRALADRVDITAQTKVLDAGCGIGGGARFLADTYGCSVVGIDLAEEFVAAAAPLNDLLGLADKVSCRVGDMTNTGFDDGSFDLVWSQNVLMNIEDKPAVLREMHRVLKTLRLPARLIHCEWLRHLKSAAHL